MGIKNDEKLEFHILSLATRSSLDKKHIEQEMEKGIKLTKTIQIQCRTINDILEECADVPDLLSIDIEGMDFQVLQTLDYEKYKIKVIVAESSGGETNDNNETMNQFMSRQGYEINRRTKANTIYILRKGIC